MAKLNSLTKEQLNELADGLIASTPRFRDTAVGGVAMSIARTPCCCCAESATAARAADDVVALPYNMIGPGNPLYLYRYNASPRLYGSPMW